jgi:hypothetical protein
VLVSRVCCIDGSLCDGLITHSEESYGVNMCLVVCDLRTSSMKRPVQELDCSATHTDRIERSHWDRAASSSGPGAASYWFVIYFTVLSVLKMM